MRLLRMTFWLVEFDRTFSKVSVMVWVTTWQKAALNAVQIAEALI